MLESKFNCFYPGTPNKIGNCLRAPSIDRTVRRLLYLCDSVIAQAVVPSSSDLFIIKY
jgi:hypothetical protein